MARHDENQDLSILSRRFTVNRGFKTITIPKDQPVGIRTWGRIDYLTHYCGYRLLRGNAVVMTKNDFDDSNKKKNYKQLKKMARENSMENKGKKQQKRK